MTIPMRYLIRAAASIAAIALLTGCWDRIEVNDIAIILGAGIDQEENNKVKLSVEIYLPAPDNNESGGGQEGMDSGSKNGNILVSSAIGSSMADAMSKLQKRLSRRLYWGHNNVYVFGKERAERGFNDDLDFFLRYVRARERTNIYVTQGKAIDTMGVIPRLDQNLMEALTELSKTEVSIDVDLKTVMEQIVETPEQTYTVPYILTSAVMSEKKHLRNANVPYFRGLTIFKKGRMIGSLDNELTHGYFWITNQIKASTILTAAVAKDETVAVNLTASKSKLIPKIDSSGEWRMELIIECEGNLIQNASRMDYSVPEQLTEIEDLFEAMIKKNVDKSLNVIQQKYKSDILGYSRLFRRKYPKQWAAAKPEWSETFLRIKTDTSVNFQIRRPGALVKQINNIPME
ncbi:Ger(x)C family spore germination protein [Paenibacillus pinisoli]|uniref:Ger(X)C family spore germination protein n=1 Tax=Paenibacillus pinisoli TaxID=1276110 RepID=A0A3A6PUX8_9BACL|nr:Ger(x)C family spore germination protein [Paenibacillus pinisoli]RJX37684.1 Ger(x)C family spore germination protein [Paenibacillus pinisoli]